MAFRLLCVDICVCVCVCVCVYVYLSINDADRFGPSVFGKHNIAHDTTHAESGREIYSVDIIRENYYFIDTLPVSNIPNYKKNSPHIRM